jgi:hypothetical protein
MQYENVVPGAITANECAARRMPESPPLPSAHARRRTQRSTFGPNGTGDLEARFNARAERHEQPPRDERRSVEHDGRSRRKRRSLPRGRPYPQGDDRCLLRGRPYPQGNDRRLVEGRRRPRTNDRPLVRGHQWSRGFLDHWFEALDALGGFLDHWFEGVDALGGVPRRLVGGRWWPRTNDRRLVGGRWWPRTNDRRLVGGVGGLEPMIDVWSGASVASNQ